MKKFGLIYKVTNTINGKIYIGQTTQGLIKRKYNHVWAATNDKYKNKCNDFFHNAMKKYGFNKFEWCLIDECDNKEELDKKEKYYINKFKSFVGFNNCNGYNLTAGGKGNSGVVFSELHKKRLSDSMKGKKMSEAAKQKIRDNAKINPNYGNKGRQMSDITKEKLRQCNLGKKASDITKLNMSIAQKKITNRRKGWKHTEEAKERMSKSTRGNKNPMYGIPSPMTGRVGKHNTQSKVYVIITPNGDEFKVHGLKNFCENYTKEKLWSNVLVKVARKKQDNHKGYKCRYYDEKLDFNLPIWEI